jgi:hypothetical protein
MCTLDEDAVMSFNVAGEALVSTPRPRCGKTKIYDFLCNASCALRLRLLCGVLLLIALGLHVLQT